MTRSALGQFEHVVLLAILRLGDAAYAPAILVDADGERAGRPRRYVSVTAYGVRELRASRTALLKLWRGLEGVLENT